MANLVVEFYRNELSGLWDADGSASVDKQVQIDISDAVDSGCKSAGCQLIRDYHNIDYQIVKNCNNGEMKNFVATKDEKQAVCNAIWQDDSIDFSNEFIAEEHLLWAAINNFDASF